MGMRKLKVGAKGILASEFGHIYRIKEENTCSLGPPVLYYLLDV